MIARNFDPPDWIPALKSNAPDHVRMVEADAASVGRLVRDGNMPPELTRSMEEARRRAKINGCEAFVLIRVVP